MWNSKRCYVDAEEAAREASRVTGRKVEIFDPELTDREFARHRMILVDGKSTGRLFSPAFLAPFLQGMVAGAKTSGQRRR